MRAFRRDLYRRGLVTPAPLEAREWFENLTVVGLGKPYSASMRVSLSNTEVSLDPVYYEPLIEALEAGPLSLGQVQTTGIYPEVAPSEALTALTILVEGGFAAPEATGWSENGSREAAHRINRVIVEETLLGRDFGFLVAPATGSNIPASIFEILVMGALWDEAAPDVAHLAEYVGGVLAQQGRTVQEQGVDVADPTRARLIVHEEVARALIQAAGTFKRLGIS